MSFEKITFNHASEEGRGIVSASPALQSTIERFLASDQPELTVGGRFLGVGRYSTVREIDGIAIKISSPTSSRDTHESDLPRPPEDLLKQFTYMQALGGYLEAGDSDIIVPQQYFAIRSPYNGFLLGQQYMNGWEEIGEWADRIFQPDERTAFETAAVQIKSRIIRAVANTALRHGLNDLHLTKSGLHGGNILVPAGAGAATDMPLCIIDQPRTHYK